MLYCLTLILALAIGQETTGGSVRVPDSIKGKIIYQSGGKQKKRCMIVIAHHHGDVILSDNDDIPHWILHQEEILDILIEFTKQHDSSRLRFFFEGEKGQYAQWPEERRAIVPESKKAFQEWKLANVQKRELIAAEFTKKLGKVNLEKARKMWRYYDPSLGLVSNGKGRVDAIVFGSEPPEDVPLWPDLDSLGNESPGVFTLRLQKTILSNVYERNRYAALIMAKVVPENGVGVLLMGAAHSSSVYARYPKLMQHNVSGEIGLESHLGKIRDVNVVVIEPTTLKSLTKKRGAD